MAKPVLTLSIFEPRFVAIGPPGAEVNYELRWPGAMSLVDLDRLSALQKKHNDLLKAVAAGHGDPTADPADLSGLLDELVRIILRAPEELIGRLGDGAKAAILAAFQEGPAEPGEEKPRPGFRTPRRRATKAAGAQASPLTGGSGSPA